MRTFASIIIEINNYLRRCPKLKKWHNLRSSSAMQLISTSNLINSKRWVFIAWTDGAIIHSTEGIVFYLLLSLQILKTEVDYSICLDFGRRSWLDFWLFWQPTRASLIQYQSKLSHIINMIDLHNPHLKIVFSFSKIN